MIADYRQNDEIQNIKNSLEKEKKEEKNKYII